MSGIYTYEKCCKILGLPTQPVPTMEQVRKAYKQAAIQYHPDKAPEGKEEEYTELFKSISESYQAFTIAEFNKNKFPTEHEAEHERDKATSLYAENRVQAIREMAEINSLEAKQLCENIQEIQKVLDRWEKKPQTVYLYSSFSTNKMRQQEILLTMVGTYLISLLASAQLDSNRQLAQNSPWNKTIVETTSLLLAAVTTIDKLPKPDSGFGNISDHFDRIIEVLREAEKVIIRLESVRKDPTTASVYNNGLTLATALLQRVNDDFTYRLNDYKKNSEKGVVSEWGMSDPRRPAREMQALGNLLEKVLDAKSDPSKADELKTAISKHEKTTHSTTSIYWQKFKKSISDYLQKLVSGYGYNAPKNTYFDEDIRKNDLISSIKMFATKNQKSKTASPPVNSNTGSPKMKK